jgi:hypothetical protein
MYVRRDVCRDMCPIDRAKTIFEIRIKEFGIPDAMRHWRISHRKLHIRSIYLFGRQRVKDVMDASEQPINREAMTTYSNLTWLWYQHSAETALVALD